MNIVRVIDFETTGEEPPAAEVCEVGLCDFDVDAKKVLRPASWLCKVPNMPPEVRAVHHISLQECSNSDPFHPDFLLPGGWIVWAAHNAAFEQKFYDPGRPVICTYKAALRVWPDAPSHSNNGLRYWLEDQGKIDLDPNLAQPAHRAGPDAYVTAHVLKALFAEGATGQQMVSWTKEHPLLPKCPIGEHRGKPWAEVDAGFLSWMLRTATMDPGLKWCASQELQRRRSSN